MNYTNKLYVKKCFLEEEKIVDCIRRRLSILIVFISVIVILICCAFSYKYYHGLKEININNYKTREDMTYHVNQINKMNTDYDHISGWILKRGNKIRQFNTKLVLYRSGDNCAYTLPLKLCQRPDVTKVFAIDHIDYNNSGFEAKIAHKYMKNNKFKIGFIVNVNKNDYFVKTNINYSYRG